MKLTASPLIEPASSAEAEPLLVVADACASYGPVQVLRGVDLCVAAGEVVCLLGRNGAGKTTAMRMISGLLSATSGTVRFDGRDITRESPVAIVKAGLATVPEGRRVFANMTVRENLLVGAFSIRGSARPNRVELDEVFALFPRLAERARQLAGTLSGGEQQMLAIGRAVMARPRLLLLDEPSLGLAPMLIDRTFETIDRLARSGMTVLLVEQNAVAALDVSDRAYVLEGGRIVHHGPADGIAGRSDVQASYLGRQAIPAAGDHPIPGAMP